MILGRSNELELLNSLKSKKTASLAVIKGRRRIGKSTLASEFGSKSEIFFKFEGLAPRAGQTNQDQLDHFSEQLSLQLKISPFQFKSWSEAFETFSKFVLSKKVVVIFDEISWMGSLDSDFVGKLKVAWDNLFKKNNKLILILCGSVSSWINKNLLQSTDFVGRISLVIKLEELDLKSGSLFWGNYLKFTQSKEILAALSVFGAIPKYLEEYDPQKTLSENIKKMCFKSTGYLFNDFERIFSDIFGKRSSNYKKIIKLIVLQKLSASEIAKKLGKTINGDIIEYLSELEESNFISREYSHDIEGKLNRISRYRLKDNYLRFYLKYIEPNYESIKKNNFSFNSLDELINWKSILGLQFENLVLNHFNEIIPYLGLQNEVILSASQHFQSRTTRQKACQVDLLISCKGDLRYVCEIKFKNLIGIDVVREVRDKLDVLKFAKRTSVRPVLIYAGELDLKVEESNFFYKIINIEEIINKYKQEKI